MVEAFQKSFKNVFDFDFDLRPDLRASFSKNHQTAEVTPSDFAQNFSKWAYICQ